MTYTYKLLANTIDPITGDSVVNSSILRKEDGAFIPFDPANTDYQDYLAWVAEGNTPAAAEHP